MRRAFAARELGEVTALGWSDAAALVAALKDGTPTLAIASIGGDNGTGISFIDALKREHPELPIIATGPAPNPDLILRAVRAGAVEFLVRPLQAAEFAEALDRVLAKAGMRSRSGRCIAVYSAKGGLGSTTVAVNLAFALARKDPNLRVALVDLVVQGGDVRVFLDIRPGETIKDVVEQQSSLDRHEFEAMLHECPDGVWVCPDPNLPDEGELLTGRRVVAVLRRLAESFDFVVVDCEHTLNERTLAVLDHAERIVLLTHLTLPAIRSLQRTMDLFSRLEYSADKVSVVVNRYGSKGDLTLSDLEKVLERPVTAKLPNDYRATIDAAARGRPIHIGSPKSKIASALDNLAVTLNGGPPGGKLRGGLGLFRRKTE